MISIEVVDTRSKSKVNEFIQLHYRLYKGHPQWVPPFIDDIKLMLNTEKHPFYEHSEGESFVAKRGEEVVGRIMVLENKPFNRYHDTHKAQFYLFDCVEDQEVANCLFNTAFEWCHKHKLDTVVGPKGLSPFDGYGVQIEGFEHRQMMTMMNYNFPYYPELFDRGDFQKEVDFVSCKLPENGFVLPEKVREIARRLKERGKFKVSQFRTKKDLKTYADRIGQAYNKTFVNNWEYYPLSEREIKFVVDNIMMVAVPPLIKLITYNDEVIGFLLGFPDISGSLQRHGGRITPWGLADIMIDLKRSRSLSLNGVGVLPEYHGRGGNALMYYEMEQTIKDFKYQHIELTQMAETAVQVRRDLVTAGAIPYKNHRIYTRKV
jgi:hypothetical protein